MTGLTAEKIKAVKAALLEAEARDPDAGRKRLNEQVEMVAFERIMGSNTAKLMDFAKPYVGRLGNKDREYLLQEALNFMWQRRKQHNPKAESLLQYWDKCLRAAALKKSEWLVSRFDGWTRVTGANLGAQGV